MTRGAGAFSGRSDEVQCGNSKDQEQPLKSLWATQPTGLDLEAVGLVIKEVLLNVKTQAKLISL